MYGIVVKPEFGMTRDELAVRLTQQGVETRTFFCPMNSQPCFDSMANFRAVPTPVADMLWRCGLYLPSSHTLNDEQIEFVAGAVANIHRSRN
jgi:perosamine synthetase